MTRCDRCFPDFLGACARGGGGGGINFHQSRKTFSLLRNQNTTIFFCLQMGISWYICTLGKPPELQATLAGVELPVQQEFRQLGVGVWTWLKRGAGPLLKQRIANGKTALRKARVIPGGFDRKATVAAMMIVAAALFWGRVGGHCAERCEQYGGNDHDGHLGAQQAVQGQGVSVYATDAR